MGIAARDNDIVTSYTDGSVAATIDVAEGDLIVVFVGVYGGSPYCNDVADDIGNEYIVRDNIRSYSSTLVFAYCLSSIGANAANVITATFNAVAARQKNIIASCYTPDVGDVVTLEDASNKLTNDAEASP